jgi:hypothetical protein
VQCTVNLDHELKEDVWLFLGEYRSVAWVSKEDVLNDGWLHCGEGEFDTGLFPEPTIKT